MIGTRAVRGSPWTASASSKPFMPGISISDTMTSKRGLFFSSASASFGAAHGGDVVSGRLEHRG